MIDSEYGFNLRKLQEVQLEILIEFDRICRENDIPYQLFAGTLLGSVRHEGFIPWDDDIDVCMLRKDYNRFLDIAKNKLSSKYFLQNYETDKEFIHSFSRIRKNNTLMIQKAWENLDMHQGIFIDIFPMDKVLPGKTLGKIQRYLIYKLRKHKRFKIKNIRVDSSTPLRQYIKTFISILLKPFSIQMLNRLETKLSCMFEKRNTIYSTLLSDGYKDDYDKCMIENNKFHDIINIKFESYEFLAPKNYDEILTNLYGNYMILPSVEKQAPHHGIVKLDFNYNV